METLKIRAIGESTFCGYYDGQEHKNDLNACIPLMVKDAVEQIGIACEMDNQAVPSSTIDWHLGIKDGDESPYEPDLIVNPPGTLYELAKSKSNIVIISMGINAAVSVEPVEFCTDFITLIRNCKMTGKKVYVTMPNSIHDGENDKLSAIAMLIGCVSNIENVTVVNGGLQDVSMNDNYHPNPGTDGYEALGSALRLAVAQDSEQILNSVVATRFYIAMFNKTPEKGGLDYWSKELSEKGRDEVAQAIISFVESVDGATTNSEFIGNVYNNIMCRDPDHDGMDYWIDVIEDNPIHGRGVAMNQILDVLVNGTAESGQSYDDQCSLQNWTSAGFAYGSIYGIEDVAPELNLVGVDHNFESVYNFTNNL